MQLLLLLLLIRVFELKCFERFFKESVDPIAWDQSGSTFQVLWPEYEKNEAGPPKHWLGKINLDETSAPDITGYKSSHKYGT